MYISNYFGISSGLQVLVTGEAGKSKEIVNLTFDSPYATAMYIRFFVNNTPFYTHEVAVGSSVLDLSECPIIINAGQTLSAQMVRGGSVNVRIFGVVKEISE